MTIQVLQHQHDFITDITTRYIGLVGGVGSGKTLSFCLKALYLASLNIGFEGVLVEPTYKMVRNVLVKTMNKALAISKIPYDFLKGEMEYKVHFASGDCTLKCWSAVNYDTLSGLNLAFFGVDECDLIRKDNITEMWQILQARLREGNIIQGFASSTPEGYNFLYEFFYKHQNDPRRRMITARTYDNPFLNKEYIEDLEASYPTQLVKAYLNGEFVNLKEGSIYYAFDRQLNHTDISLDNPKYENHILHIGQDFNIGKCSSIVHIVDNQKPIAVDEIMNALNTEEVIEIVKMKYPNRCIIFYPDSSGKNRHTSNASQTDLLLLRQAGFQLDYLNKNPNVKDRINSMNAMFCNYKKERKYFINTNKCPLYTEALEQQCYINGVPDKKHDQDHPNDAAGYFINKKFPIRQRGVIRQY